MMALPHPATDWCDMLDEVWQCYRDLISHIIDHETVLLIAPCKQMAEQAMQGLLCPKLKIIEADTNDTWTRDYGPITIVHDDGTPDLLDFRFNAWGMKFAAHLDNQVVPTLHAKGVFKAPLVNWQGFVLEGGSIESDGNGTIMTTTQCLLSRNRNDALSKDEIERTLKHDLGAEQVLWINHGALDGDDTDAHIDTLARFAPGNTILFSGALTATDAQSQSLLEMEAELRMARNASGAPYRLLKLPTPDAMLDDEGHRMPATYANFLVTNHKVLVPTYGQPSNDRQALSVIATAFTGRAVEGVDCRALIHQHGSLHCATMQIPKNTLS